MLADGPEEEELPAFITADEHLVTSQDSRWQKELVRVLT